MDLLKKQREPDGDEVELAGVGTSSRISPQGGSSESLSSESNTTSATTLGTSMPEDQKMYRSMKNDESVQSDLSFWRGGQFQHNNILWLQSAAELNRSNHVFDLQTELRPTSSFSSGKKKLEAEWEMCRREYDARIALMMLTDGNNGGGPTFSPTPTVESRPSGQLHNLKLLEDRSTSDSTGALGPRSRSDGWRFVLEDPKRPQDNNQAGKILHGPYSASRPQLDRASSSTNIYSRFQTGNPMDELSHEFHIPGPHHHLYHGVHLPIISHERHKWSPRFRELHGSQCHPISPSPKLDNAAVSLWSRPHSWPGSCTMPVVSTQSGNSRHSTDIAETEPGRTPFVDFLSVAQTTTRGHSHMGSGRSGDGLQLDLTMSTGPADDAGEELTQAVHPKNVELDLTLDLSMSTR